MSIIFQAHHILYKVKLYVNYNLGILSVKPWNIL